MYTSHTTKPGVGETFILQYVASILQYAKVDTTFGHTLAAQVRTQKWSAASVTPKLSYSLHTYPVDQPDALSTANWILTTLQSHPEYTTARGKLSHWAQNYESPKDLVLGIVGLAIIGPTLGIISSKKKKKRKSQLVLEEAYLQTLSRKELALLTTKMTNQVMAIETKLAGGNVYTLHPDSAAWCIEEALTQIYTDSPTNLHSLLKLVTEERLSHQVMKDDTGKIQAIVISPSVNDALVEESDADPV